MLHHVLLSFLAFSSSLRAAEWPQWRGPLRNGIQPDSPKLLDVIPESGLKEVWESEPIPANDEGGLSSPIAAGGKVFVSLVWHRDVPSKTRQIDELVLRQLGFQGTGALGEDLVAKMEETRASIAPSLRGKKLDEFINQWIKENLDEKQRQLFGGFVSNRFKKGKLAIPLDVLETLDRHKNHIFGTDGEMKQWLDAQGWGEEVRQRIIAAVPPTTRVADDAVLCLDLASGKTVWKATVPGAPVGRTASSTPCVTEGRVFTVGSTRIWCVDAMSGKTVWETPLKKKGAIGSSPAVADGALIVNADTLVAFEVGDGQERWRQERAGGGSSSPVAWTAGGKTLVIINGRSDLHGIDAQTGELAWTVPGAGDSTPAISGDTLVVQSRKPEVGLVAYHLDHTGATKLWNHPMDALRTQSSPIIHETAVYLMDDNVHYCFDLATGGQRWRETVSSAITSPALADGKLFVMANSGNTLLMLKATPDTRTELGKATVRSVWIPSPCLVDGRLVLRTKDRLKCWSLLP